MFFKGKDYVMINNNLGSGSFGKTVLLQDPFIDELFVAKKYEPEYESLKKEFYESFIQEIKIMYKLFHPNVVRVFSYYPYETLHTGYILMEYIEGDNIADYLENFIGWEDTGDPDSLFLQLIDGFEYIEKQGIVHRDIREGNILVTKEGIVKIIDFGLGKTFSPVDTSVDSVAAIVNRSGLDSLPNEYFEGKYDSLTDMFYLAELFNRLLRLTDNEAFFSYKAILNKMMEPNRENRYQSFAEIKEAVSAKDFSTLQISAEDKEIYQRFSNAILNCLLCFYDKRVFVESVDEFSENLKNVIQKNCFEDEVQNINDFVSIVVKGNYKYYKKEHVPCKILINFEKWFSSLSESSKRLVFNNIISKTSTVQVELTLSDELPF